MNKDTKFSLAVNVKREDEKALVYYKQDGERFESNCTIKMNVETAYKFLLCFRPPLKIRSGSLKGSGVEVKEDSFSSEQSTYTLFWTSHEACVSKNKSRDRFPLVLTVQDLGILEIPMQFKFYKSDDTGHSIWGNEIHHIEYECIYKGGTMSFSIAKEVFR